MRLTIELETLNINDWIIKNRIEVYKKQLEKEKLPEGESDEEIDNEMDNNQNDNDSE